METIDTAKTFFIIAKVPIHEQLAENKHKRTIEMTSRIDIVSICNTIMTARDFILAT